MYIETVIELGAAGGAIAEVVNRWVDLIAWQKARHTARMRKQPLPTLGRYIDPLADGLVALTRILMGAGVGWLLHAQVTGVSAAIAVGAAAPALLAQVGASHGSRGSR